MSSSSREGRVLPPTYLLIAALLMGCLHFVLPMRRIIVFPYRYAGIALLAAGVALNVWASRLFERAGTTIRPFQRSSSVVVRGPYRLSRNPMYLGMVVALTGIGVLAGSIGPFLVVPPFVLLLDRVFIRVEEADLEEALGEPYLDYKARVRRWI